MRPNDSRRKKAEARACKTKKRFNCRERAKRARSSIPKEMRIYECNFCNGFHLTSQLRPS